MRRILIFLFSLQVLFFSGLFAAEWRSDYDKALIEARDQHKPIVLAFLGTAWCPWSQKLQSEVLSKEGFQSALDGFVLVKLDVSQFHGIEGRHSELKAQFGIEEFPTVVVMDSSEVEMARMGYMPFPAEEFAALLQEIHQSHEEIRHSSLTALNGEVLQDLYLKALKFGFNTFRYDILAQGLKTDNTPFFLLEKYKLLVESGKSKDAETAAVRKELLKRDPKNTFGVHRTLAIVDFHKLSSRYRLRKKPDEVVKPLLDYVKKFGESDTEHLWKIEMMIAQFYFGRDKAKEALFHAEVSYKNAPVSAKEEIAQSITLLKTKL